MIKRLCKIEKSYTLTVPELGRKIFSSCKGESELLFPSTLIITPFLSHSQNPRIFKRIGLLSFEFKPERFLYSRHSSDLHRKVPPFSSFSFMALKTLTLLSVFTSVIFFELYFGKFDVGFISSTEISLIVF